MAGEEGRLHPKYIQGNREPSNRGGRLSNEMTCFSIDIEFVLL